MAVGDWYLEPGDSRPQRNKAEPVQRPNEVTMALRVLLADDHEVVRDGLKALLTTKGFDVVGEAPDGRNAVRMVATTRPDVAVLDLSMPQLNGIDAARIISRRFPNTRPILLTVHNEDPYVMDGLRAGIRGYVLKTQA